MASAEITELNSSNTITASTLTDYQVKVSEGMAARWTFDEASGTSVADTSGNSLNGTTQGGPTVVSGQFSNARQFTAGSSQYVDVANNLALASRGEVSISAWAKRSRTNGLDIVLEKGGDWTAGADYGLGLHSVNNYMCYFYFNGGWRGVDGVSDLNWHHYYVYAKAGNPNPSIYIDGSLRAINYTGGSTAIAFNPTSTANLHIGAQVAGANTFYGSNAIDDLRLYNRQLSSTEITALYTSNVAGILDNAYTKSLESGGDIRFTTSDGKTEIPYYIENYTAAGQNATIWAKTTLAAGDNTVYLYYGNDGVTTTSNGSNTFTFFDDFASLNTGTWTATGAASASNSQLSVTTGAVYTKNTVVNEPGYVTEAKLKYSNFVGYSGLSTASAASIALSNSGKVKVVQALTNNGAAGIVSYANDGVASGYNVSNGTAEFTSVANQSFIISETVSADWVIIARDRYNLHSYTGTWTAASYLYLGNWNGSAAGTTDISDTVVDWVMVRQYAPAEPSLTMPARQSLISTSALNPTLNPTSGQSYDDQVYGFVETKGDNSTGSITYQISDDGGTTWYWWNGSAWASAGASPDVSKSNDATTINAHLLSFSTSPGTKTFTWRAYFQSDSTQQPKLDDLKVYYKSTLTPNISSFVPTTGPAGTTVTITGTKFGESQGTRTLKLNGTLASPSAWSDTSITVQVPLGSTTGTWRIDDADNNEYNISSGTFTVTTTDCPGGSGDLTISANTSWSVGNYACNSLTVNTGATLTIAGNTTVNLAKASGNALYITGNSKITVQGDTTNNVGVTIKTLNGNATIDSGSSINGNSQGYGIGQGIGAGGNQNCAYGGAGHGGIGGATSSGSTGGTAYDSIINPVNLGSGGQDGVGNVNAGKGGGAIVLNIAGSLTLNGSLTANGGNGVSPGNCTSSGGAGGTVNITTGTLAGSTGTVSANGGNGPGNAAGGGGGRIAIIYTTDSYTGGISSLTKTTYGGTSGNMQYGAAGTIYLKRSGVQTNGELIVDNNNNGNTLWERTPSKTANMTVTDPLIFDVITIRNKGDFLVSSGHTLDLSSTTYNFSGSGVLSISGTVTWPSNNITIPNGGIVEYGGTGQVTLNTVTIQNGGTLSHLYNVNSEANKLNLAITTLDVQTGGSISADSKGFSIGQGTGVGGNQNCNVGGGGHGGVGGDASGSTGGGAYGSIINPVNLGSGGQNGDNNIYSGRGGGAIILNVSGTATISGTISAGGGNGIVPGNCTSSGGAGGSVNITAGTITGSGGTVKANGGNAAGGVGGGGGGRVSIIYTTDSYTSGISSLSKQAYGGTSTVAQYTGAAGTIYLKHTGVETNGELIVDNNNNWHARGPKTPSKTANMTVADPLVFDVVTFQNKGNFLVASGHTLNLSSATYNFASNGVLSIAGTVPWPSNNITFGNGRIEYGGTGQTTLDTITIQSGGVLSHIANTSTEAYKLNLALTTLDIQSGGSINVDGQGFTAGYGTGGALGATFGGGGSYSGKGGSNAAATGSAYGSITNPVDLGSGGGTAQGQAGGAGGGAIIVTVSGTATLNGAISANGGTGIGYGGGGSGGTINLTAGTVTGGSTSLSANGGAPGDTRADGGGGGRISVTYTTDNYSGGLSSMAKTVYGGSTSTGQYGGEGTIYVKPTSGNGDLFILGNNPSTTPARTPIESTMADFPNTIFGSLTIAGKTQADIAGGITLNVTGDAKVLDSGTNLYSRGLRPITSPNATSSGLVGYWNLDEASGNVADSSGNNTTGTVTGTTVINPGKYGRARSFNGTSSDKIDLGNPAVLRPANITIVAWVNPGASITGYRDALAQYGGGSNGWILRTSESGNGHFTPYFYVGGTWYNCDGGALTSGQWTQVAISYDGETVKGYINGSQVCQNTNPSGNLSLTGSTTIGGSSTSEWYNGSVDDVRIYNRALTDIEVLRASENNPADTGGQGLVINSATFTLASGTNLNADGVGYVAGVGSGRATGNSGASYGGLGGQGTTGAPGSTYGTSTNPIDLGSGGGGGAGGGAVKIVATGAMTINGTMSANGADSASGAGSGGSIYLQSGNATFTINNGVIRANGGNGSASGGGGGGGRVLIMPGGAKAWTNPTITATAGTNGTGATNGTTSILPSAPTMAIPDTVTTTGITWKWTDNSDNEDEFKIYNDSNVLVQTVASTTRVGTGSTYTWTETVTPGSSHSRYARAKDNSSALESLASNSITQYALPAQPTITSLTTNSPTQQTLVFGAAANDASVVYAIYDNQTSKYIQRSDGTEIDSADWKTYSQWGSGSKTITSLGINTLHQYKVQAKSGDTTLSSWSSNTSSLYTHANVPGNLSVTIPRNVGADTLYYLNSTNGMIKLQANSNPAATQFAVSITVTAPVAGSEQFLQDPSSNQSALGASATWHTLAEWNGTSGTTITGLTENTTYSVKVKARNQDQVETVYNTPASFSTPLTPVPPTTVHIADASDTLLSHPRLVLDWSAVDNVMFDYYIVDRSVDGGGYSDIAHPESAYYDDNDVTADHTYSYRIKTHTNVPDTSAASVIVSARPGQTPDITGVTVGTPTNNGVTITWTTDIAADSMIEYGPDTSYGLTAGSLTIGDPGTSHSVTIAGLTSSTLYHFRVRATGGSGKSVNGSDGSFTTAPDIYPEISSISSGTPGFNSAVITWATDINADSLVEFGSAGAGVYTNTQGASTLTKAHSITLVGLSMLTTYHYRVLSRAANGNQSVSGDLSFQTGLSGEAEATLTFSNISVKTDKADPAKATIVWNTNKQATTQIIYGTDQADLSSQSTEKTTKTVEHFESMSSLAPNTTYYFKVKGTDNQDNTVLSSVQNFTTAYDAPVVTNITVPAESITQTSAVINWTTDIATDTTIKYGPTVAYGQVAGNTEATGTSHTLSITKLNPSTTYNFRVTARNNIGLLTTSSNITFTTLDPIIPLVTNLAVAKTATQATISWNTSVATNTILDYGTTSNYGSTSGDINAEETSHSVILRNLTPSTTYHYGLRITDNVGQTIVQEDNSFTTDPAITPVISNVETSRTANSITITWETDVNADTVVEYGTTESYGATFGNTDASEQTHTVTVNGLLSTTSYHLRIKTKDNLGNLIVGDDQIITTLSIQVPVVTDLTVTAGLTTATISWKTDILATSFVEFGTTTFYGTTQGNDTATATHTVTLLGLEMGKTYHLRVKSTSGDGGVAASEDQTMTTGLVAGDTTVPQISTTDSLVDGQNSKVVITWDTNKLATSQVLYGITETLGSATTLDPIVTMKHYVAIQNLTAATTYYYQTKSVDVEGNPVVSEIKSFTTPASPDASAPAISAVQVTDITLTSAIISWKTNVVTSSAISLGMSDSYGQTIEDKSTGSTTIHTVRLTDLVQGTVYHFRIKGRAENNAVIASDDYVFATLTMPVIANIQVKEIASDRATVTWQTNTETDSFVDFGTTSGTFDQSQGRAETVKDHAVTLVGLKPATSYSYRVKSRDIYTNLATSENKTFQTIVDTTPPVIKDMKSETSIVTDANGESKAQALISWSTDEPATGQVQYSLGVAQADSYQYKTTEDDSFTTSHIVVLNNLQPSATYHLRILSRDESNNIGLSDDYTVLTLNKETTLLQYIVQILEERFGWVKNLGVGTDLKK